MFLPAGRHHGSIGIDIGTDRLRAAQLERRGGKLAVRAWWDLPMQATAAARKPVAAPAGTLACSVEAAAGTAGTGSAATVEDRSASPEERRTSPPADPMEPPQWPTIDGEGFAGNEVVVSLSPPEVECTPLRVPENLLKLEQRDLVSAIRHEVGRNISLPIEQVEMDVWRLPPGHSDSPNLMVTAARRGCINRVLAWLQGQGLICRLIDVGPLAGLRSCGRLANRPPADHLWGVLDVGKCAVRLYIGIGEVPVYVRCVPRAGEEMTRRISEELGIDRATAESYKRHYGIQSSDGHYRPAGPGDEGVDSRRMAGILLGALRPILRSVGEEIQRSFRYAMGLYPDRPIAGLWMVGGGSNLHGLSEILSELLGITVQRTRPDLLPSDLLVPSGFCGETLPGFMPLLGTCLGGMDP